MDKCQKWYNDIAKRNNGYKSDARFIKEGLSGEDVFEKRLIKLLPNYNHVLDIGCGHGEFSLKMSKYAKHLTGGDSAVELINIANHLKKKEDIKNVDFIYFHTHEIESFEGLKFDLIYNRRGPTSIYDYKRLLSTGGMIISIHPLYALDKVKQRLTNGGFKDIKIEVFNECKLIFDSVTDFAEHISSMHMSKDYTLEINREELDKLVEKHTNNGRLSLCEERFIVTAS